MIHELKDISKVRRLFKDVDSMDAVDADIRVFVTDPDTPRSARTAS